MSVKLLTEHHLEFLTFKGDCIGSSEFTLVKMSNCWKSHATAHYYNCVYSNGFSLCCIMDFGGVRTLTIVALPTVSVPPQ